MHVVITLGFAVVLYALVCVLGAMLVREPAGGPGRRAG
jgi:hypothetical protein